VTENHTTDLRVTMTVEQCWQPQPGGSARYIRELATELARHRGLRVTGLAARHPAGDEPVEGPLPVPVRHSALPRPVLYRAWQRWRRPLGDRDADVVHATTWALPGHRRPLVVTVHDLAFRQDPAHFTQHGTAFFERGLDLVRREATEVIVPSEVTRDQCLAAGLRADRMTVVPHGVRAPGATPEDTARFRARHGLSRPYALWTGTREPRKNLPVLLQAFDRLVRSGADLDLVLVGPEGWGSEEARLTGPTGDRVRVLGRLDPADLDCAYAGATVFCYPSLREGYGMPVTEAMAHGLPVVTSVGTATEEAAGGAAVLVDPRDPRDVARGMAEALEPGRRGELTTASLRRAGQLSWARAAEQTADVLLRAAGR
jgi:glycosyltransferase involved in cell wall biosynthesis